MSESHPAGQRARPIDRQRSLPEGDQMLCCPSTAQPAAARQHVARALDVMSVTMRAT